MEQWIQSRDIHAEYGRVSIFFVHEINRSKLDLDQAGKNKLSGDIIAKKRKDSVAGVSAKQQARRT
ncbi:hypothetical protein E4U35_004790, partial [Claviceps purpurea]